MGFMFALPMLLSWLGSGTVSLPNICSNPDYECIRATQLPQRYTAAGFGSSIPDPPWPSTPPVNYFPFASEGEMIALRTVQGTDETQRLIRPPNTYCYFQFEGPEPWPPPDFTPGGFLPQVKGRLWHYTWAYTPVGQPACSSISHNTMKEGYMAPICWMVDS